jgi:hypothetical protein
MRKIITILLFLSAFALLSGCGTLRLYPGEQRPKANIAVFQCPKGMVKFWLGDSFIPNLATSNVEMLPGIHRLAWSRPEYSTGRTYNGMLWFQAEAGHTYTSQFKPSTGDFTGGLVAEVVDITDPDHKIVVLAISPPPDEKSVQPDHE